MLKEIFFSHYYLKRKKCTAFFLYEFDVVYEKNVLGLVIYLKSL